MLRSLPRQLAFGVLALVLVVALAVGGSLVEKRIPNVGKIVSVGVEVYWTTDFSQVVEFIDWGFLEPGETKVVSCYVYNPGNIPLDVSVYVEDWLPVEAGNFINVTGVVAVSPVPAGVFSGLQINLVVDPMIEDIDGFSMDIIVEGSFG